MSFDKSKGNENRGKSKNRMSKSRNGRNLECWNCSKTCHLKKNCRALRKNEDKNNDVANTITDEVWDALILSVDNSCDFWVLDSVRHSTLLHNVIFWRIMLWEIMGLLG